ncbi:MAG: Ig-like domain-containing protein [Vulcanimicrobiota bacterium]
MEKKAGRIVLGYDAGERRWTAGELTARVCSLSEPDRAVPLSARLEIVPDILSYELDTSAQDCFHARLQLKPEAVLPLDHKALVTVIADPAAELGLQATALAAGISLPLAGLFKQMRALVEVELVPFALDLCLEKGPLASVLEVEGDAHSELLVKARVVEVDAGGRWSNQAVPAQLECHGQLADVEISSRLEDGLLWVRLKSKKTRFDSVFQAGELSFRATLAQGGQLERKLSVQVLPLQARWQWSRNTLSLDDSAGCQVTLELVNSKNQPVAGIPTQWSVEPAAGHLSAIGSVTDASGRCSSHYNPPGLELANQLFRGPQLSLTARVEIAGVILTSPPLLLQYAAHLEVTVRKQGFATITRALKLDRPGGIWIRLTTGEGQDSFPVAHAEVSCSLGSRQSDADGVVTMGGGDAGNDLNLPLDSDVQALQANLLKHAEGLEKHLFATDHLAQSLEKARHFARVDYLKQVAGCVEKDVSSATFHLKMVQSMLAMGQRSLQFFERRYGMVRERVGTAMGNLAGLFFSWAGETYFPKIGAWLGRKLAALFQVLVGRLARRPWLMSKLQAGVELLSGWLDAMRERAQRLHQRVGPDKNRLPEKLQQRLNEPFEVHAPRIDLVPPEELQKAVRETTERLTRCGRARDQMAAAVQAAEGECEAARRALASQTEAAGRAAREAELAAASARLDKARAGAEQAGRNWDEAHKAAEEAAQGWKQAESACQTGHQILSLFARGLSLMYEYGALLTAYFLASVGKALLANMRVVFRGVHSQVAPTLTAAVEDLFTKKAFTWAFELGGYTILGGIFHAALLFHQSNALAASLEEGLALSLNWREPDREEAKKAVAWWYEELEVASFQSDEAAVWVDMAAGMADQLEWWLVWITRGLNLLLGLLGAIVSLLFTGGLTLPEWILINQTFAQAIEEIDRFWDLAKAVASSLAAMPGAAEVLGIVLPAHAHFVSRLYQDEQLAERSSTAWSYPIDDDLARYFKTMRKPDAFPGEVYLREFWEKLESHTGLSNPWDGGEQ